MRGQLRRPHRSPHTEGGQPNTLVPHPKPVGGRPAHGSLPVGDRRARHVVQGEVPRPRPPVAKQLVLRRQRLPQHRQQRGLGSDADRGHARPLHLRDVSPDSEENEHQVGLRHHDVHLAVLHWSRWSPARRDPLLWVLLLQTQRGVRSPAVARTQEQRVGVFGVYIPGDQLGVRPVHGLRLRGDAGRDQEVVLPVTAPVAGEVSHEALLLHRRHGLGVLGAHHRAQGSSTHR